MSENVIEFSGITKLDIPAETILRRASEQGLTEVLVIGKRADGSIYALSSSESVGKNLELCEMFKFYLLSGEYSK
jgi:hypothetical protein